MTKPLILLTNDDGINSPGLAAAASGLDLLGDLLIIAPLDQQTSMGRSRKAYGAGDGTLKEIQVNYQDQSWIGYGIEASPARAVEHAVLEIADRPLSLVVSGINYGENIGTIITVSGTVGAALEAADWGVPALAVSQEIAGSDYRSYSKSVDFSAAVYFTRVTAEAILAGQLPFDVDLIKLDVPLAATPETKCVATRLDRSQYYGTRIEPRESVFTSPAKVIHFAQKGFYSRTDSDAYALSKGWVSITPLSLDLSSRAPLDEIAARFNIQPLLEGE
ncbi:MAG TPA: 5'/3'-nucleotidase SurE [Chloroflexi bacterium]|nr:5'/3'-nucleotidase SurE [Chloroflexota bacterium]